MSAVHPVKLQATAIDQPPRATVGEIANPHNHREGEVSFRVKPDRRRRQDPLTGTERRRYIG